MSMPGWRWRWRQQQQQTATTTTTVPVYVGDTAEFNISEPLPSQRMGPPNNSQSIPLVGASPGAIAMSEDEAGIHASQQVLRDLSDMQGWKSGPLFTLAPAQHTPAQHESTRHHGQLLAAQQQQQQPHYQTSVSHMAGPGSTGAITSGGPPSLGGGSSMPHMLPVRATHPGSYAAGGRSAYDSMPVMSRMFSGCGLFTPHQGTNFGGSGDVFAGSSFSYGGGGGGYNFGAIVGGHGPFGGRHGSLHGPGLHAKGVMPSIGESPNSTWLGLGASSDGSQLQQPPPEQQKQQQSTIPSAPLTHSGVPGMSTLQQLETGSEIESVAGSVADARLDRIEMLLEQISKERFGS